MAISLRSPSVEWGFVWFVLLGLLLFSQVLPGYVIGKDSPLRGASIFRILDEPGVKLKCEGKGDGEIIPLKTTFSYTSKKGFPAAYSYRSTPHLFVSCNGNKQTVTPSDWESGEFDFVALAIDLFATLVITVLLSKLTVRMSHRN